MTGKLSEIAIIGNGCAAAECVKSLREGGRRGGIHIFTDSNWPIYNPMLTTYFVGGKISFDQLFPFGNTNEFYRKYEVEVHPGSPVRKLDAEQRVVCNDAGVELAYDCCLIASGASPILPPLPGIRSEKIYPIRTADDAVRLKEALSGNPGKALVIGASMVGIKAVELFHKAGMEVCLADLADRIFSLAAHPECSALIEARLHRMGIRTRFGAGVQRFEDTPGGIRAYFDGSDVGEEADLIVVCIGVRANTGFVDRCQVEVQQGVLVDGYMRTNAPGLYAAGDVSQGKNLLTGSRQIIGLLANARYQGRTAARSMLGLKEPFPGNILHNITHFMGMDFIGIGNVSEYDRLEQKRAGERFIQFFWKDGLMTGANLLDACTESGVVKNAVVKGLMHHKPVCGGTLPIIQDILLKNILAEVGQNGEN